MHVLPNFFDYFTKSIQLQYRKHNRLQHVMYFRINYDFNSFYIHSCVCTCVCDFVYTCARVYVCVHV